MDFIVYFNGGAVDHISASDKVAAQRFASSTNSRPVVAIEVGASEDDREAARRESIRLNQDNNYSQPLVQPAPSSAAGRVEEYLRSQSVNTWIVPSGGGPMLSLMDMQTALLQRQLLLAALETARGEIAAACVLLENGDKGQPPHDAATMILDRLSRSIATSIATAVQS